jgi:hypothetical protein
MATRTQTTTFKHLAGKGKLGTVLVRLMMFVNDLGLCNDALEQWHKYEDEPHKKRSAGAKMYFVRLMIAHIFEALKIVNKINGDPDLKYTVGQCDRKTQELFKKVVAIVGTDQAKTMGKVRNDITFHYIHDKVDTALASLAKRFPDVSRPISIGERTIDWYYEPSDRVIDNAVLKEIFEVPEDADLGAEIGKIIERMQSIGDDLATFAGQFIFHHAAKS